MSGKSILLMGVMGAALALAQPALAQDRPPAAFDAAAADAGMAAAKAGNYAEAIRLWTPLAEGGNAVAQDDLALVYRDGRGVPQDYAKSLYWYHKAADQGFSPAQSDLGHMYLDGLGVPKDPAAAVAWYQKAAAQGYAPAEFNLGRQYERGEGVAKDDATAAGWYQKAADQGLAQAQENLAGMYDRGAGVPKDDAKAFSLYQKAAAQGSEYAQYDLGLAYANGRGTPRDLVLAYKWVDLAAIRAKAPAVLDAANTLLARLAALMTPAQIDQAKQMAGAWTPGSADQSPAGDRCSGENIASQPFGSCSGRTVVVPNKGEYATIDTKPIGAALARLKASQGPDRDAVVSDLITHADQQAPVTLFMVAGVYESKGSYDDALFWAHAAYVRSLYDGMRCTDTSAVSGANQLMAEILRGMGTHRPTVDQLKQVSERALAWDTATPRNYDQRWLCLHSMDAISTGLGNPPAHEHIFAPESDWPGILDKAHALYRGAVEQIITQTSAPPQAPAQPAPSIH